MNSNNISDGLKSIFLAMGNLLDELSDDSIGQLSKERLSTDEIVEMFRKVFAMVCPTKPGGEGYFTSPEKFYQFEIQSHYFPSKAVVERLQEIFVRYNNEGTL